MSPQDMLNYSVVDECGDGELAAEGTSREAMLAAEREGEEMVAPREMPRRFKAWQWPGNEVGIDDGYAYEEGEELELKYTISVGMIGNW